jgi:hypothetical protein
LSIRTLAAVSADGREALVAARCGGSAIMRVGEIRDHQHEATNR